MSRNHRNCLVVRRKNWHRRAGLIGDEELGLRGVGLVVVQSVLVKNTDKRLTAIAYGKNSAAALAQGLNVAAEGPLSGPQRCANLLKIFP